MQANRYRFKVGMKRNVFFVTYYIQVKWLLKQEKKSSAGLDFV